MNNYKNILYVVCIISLALFFYYISPRAAKVTHGFASYYTFSRIMLEEKNLSKAYDTVYFNSKIKDFGIQNVWDMPNNIPTSSLMYAPVAFFNPEKAKIIWTVTGVLLFFISIVLLLNIFDIKLSSFTGLIPIIISFLFLPVYHGFELGQAYVFLLFLFSLSLYGFKKEKLLLTSIPLALMLILKGYGVFPLILFALLRKWKMFFAIILISIFIILIAIPLTGLDAWIIYVKDVLFKMAGNEYASFTAYQTINSFERHIFNFQSPVLNFAVVLMLAVLFVYLALRNKKVYENRVLLLYSTFGVFNVIFAPLAEDYHYALLLPMIFGTGKIIIEDTIKKGILPAVFIISLLLISVPFNYKALNDASFPLILLAYPRLYGGILLLGMLSFPPDFRRSLSPNGSVGERESNQP